MPRLESGSRYTAQRQYGMVGFGAGPDSVRTPSAADTAAGAPPNGRPMPAVDEGTARRALQPLRVMEDPAFWLVLNIGAVIGLAAYAAGPGPGGGAG